LNRVVIDTETDALTGYQQLHVAVLRDLDTDQTATFRRVHLDPKPLSEALKDVTLIVGHNWIDFDENVLKHFNVSVPQDVEIVDTLVVSRLLNYAQEGGHSLDSWGTSFGVPKSHFSDFSQWSQELEERCIVDTLLTKRLYKTFRRYLEDTNWKPSIALEHATAYLCRTLNSVGFCYNLSKATVLELELEKKTNELSQEFLKVFPKRSKRIREITPAVTLKGSLNVKDFRWKTDNDLTPFSPGASFSLFDWEEFNPGSPKQRIERLNAAGWKPFNKTKGHIQAERDKDKERLSYFRVYGWTTDEENLATLPPDAPESARKLADWILLSSRLGDLKEWNSLWRPVSDDPRGLLGRIHGRFLHIGSWTHRKSHQMPNMANIPAILNRKGLPQPYGPEFRELWEATPGRVLVGCDAEGIQLRVFAHYCNDAKLIKAIESGKKEDETTIHHLNMQALNTTYYDRTLCNSREVAKTYIYAVLLGAGTAKQASILSCSLPDARKAFDTILAFYPGWKALKEKQITEDGKRGWFEGLDGRKVITPSTHHVLAGYLQNGESVIMKRACLLWTARLQQMQVPFWIVNDVHDEWQTETLPEYADLVGETQAQAIADVGIQLNMNCKLAGKYKIGMNWKETH
jgi:DNA polymerase I